MMNGKPNPFRRMFPAAGRNGENRDEARRRVRVLQASLVNERQRNGQEWIKCGACGWELYPEENYCTECGADRLLVPAKIVRPWLIWLRRQALNWWVIPLPWVAVWVAPADWETWTVCLALAACCCWWWRRKIAQAMRWLQRKHREDTAAGR